MAVMNGALVRAAGNSQAQTSPEFQRWSSIPIIRMFAGQAFESLHISWRLATPFMHPVSYMQYKVAVAVQFTESAAPDQVPPGPDDPTQIAPSGQLLRYSIGSEVNLTGGQSFATGGEGGLPTAYGMTGGSVWDLTEPRIRQGAQVSYYLTFGSNFPADPDHAHVFYMRATWQLWYRQQVPE